MADPGGEAHRLPLTLEPHPLRANVRQRIEGSAVEWSTAHGEKHEEALEFHDLTLPHRSNIVVIR